MKILLLGFAKVKFMPYVKLYLESIDRTRHEVHLAYWNRDLEEEDLSRYGGVAFHEFRCYQEDNVSPRRKLGSFLKYRRYMKRLIKGQKFDFIVIMHTMPGVLLYRTLCRRYADRFVFDYRDSTYERFGFFKRMIGGLIRASRCTFTSSDGFRIFFPDSERGKIYTSHNLDMAAPPQGSIVRSEHDKIRIAFWGLIRDEAVNRVLIEKLAADERFELHYYGREQAVALRLKAYAAGLKATNVFFHGEYVPAQRYEFARNTDILHNLYDSPNMMLAMGNKYYDSFLFSLPQLCMRDSVMGQCASRAGIGFECNPADGDFSQQIFNYYVTLDLVKFKQNCHDEQKRVFEEYHRGVLLLQQIFEANNSTED
ncbi:MAG: hypothetical protein IJF45_07545 [Clostridia bacterium]|nr:hypothetical protein [Clostridia bacterium]